MFSVFNRLNVTINYFFKISLFYEIRIWRERRGYMVVELPLQSVPITNKVVSSNSVHGEVYSIQYNVIKFVSDLQQVGGFSLGTPAHAMHQ